MERALRKQLNHTDVKVRDEVLLILPAIIIGFIPYPWTICFAFPYLAYAFMKNSRGWIYAMLGTLISTSIVNILYGYVFIVLFSAFCLCIQIIKFMERNVYKTLTLLCAVLTIPYLLAVNTTWNEGLIILGFTTFFTYFIQNGYHWVKNQHTISATVYVLILYGLLLILLPLCPSGYQLSLSLVFLTFIALIGNREEVCLILLFQLLTQPYPVAPGWLIALACVGIYKYHKYLRVGLLILASGFLVKDQSSLILIGVMILLTLCYRDRFIPLLAKDEPIKMPSQNLALKDMNQKLHNFSAIFDTLSKFYRESNDVQSEMLQSMAEALSYTAEEMRTNTAYDDRRLKVLNALEGYQYEVEDLIFEEMEDGNIHIEVTIRNIKRSEIKTTLIPLMEVLLKARLSIGDTQSRKFRNQYHHIVLDSAAPYMIDAYADSVKNNSDQSGDCFSIFRYRQNVICMISDGMGHGNKASQASHLVTDMFQRMMSSGIAQDHAIRCINRLLQSDTYATLDVITFDRMRGIAYISKAAACPTYLIRDKELYEISSSALPVGIIASSEPDFYMVDMHEDDLFLLASDGVYMNEITTWMKKSTEGTVKQRAECFMEILNREEREDDSTILLAQIGKARS